MASFASSWPARLALAIILLSAGQVQGQTAVQNGTSFQSFFVDQLLTSPTWVAAVRACFPNATALASVPSGRDGISLACMWDDPDTVAAFVNRMLMANGSVTAAICAESQTPTFGSLPILMSTIGWPMGLLLGALDSPSLTTSNVISSVYVPQIANSLGEELSVCGNTVGGSSSSSSSSNNTVSAATAEVSENGTASSDGSSGLNTSMPQVTVGIADDSGAQYLKGLSSEDSAHWEQKAFGRQDAQSSKPIGPLFPRTHMLLYYREDWFKQLNVTPPATWEELISLGFAMSNLPGFARTQFDYVAEYYPVETYNMSAPSTSGSPPVTEAPARPPASAEVNVPSDGTALVQRPGWDLQRWPAAGSVPSTATQLFAGPFALQGDDILRNRMPLCIDARVYCKAGDLLAAVAASIMQTQGGSQPSYIDYATLKPLIDNRGFQHALGLVHYMLLLSTPRSPVAFPRTTSYSPTGACAAASRLFSSGACAMTIDWDVAFPFFSNLVPGGAAPTLAGNIGVAPLPGSRRVWDRASNTLLACNATLCPLAANELAFGYASPLPNLQSDHSNGSSTPGDPIDHNLQEDPGTASNSSSSDGEADAPGFPSYPALNATSLQAAGVNTTWARGITINRAPYSANLRMLLRVCRAENLTSEALNLLQQATDPILQVQASMSEVLRRAYTLWLNGSHGAPSYAPSPPQNTVPLTKPPTAKLRKLAGAVGADSKGSMDLADDSDPARAGQRYMGGAPATVRARMLQQAVPSSAPATLPNDTSFVFDASWQLLQNWTQAVRFGSDITGDRSPMQLATDAADSKRFFDALWCARMGFQNQAAQPILTDTLTRYWRQAYEEALAVIIEVNNATSTSVVQGLQRRLEAVLLLEPGGQAAIKAVLYPAAGYNVSTDKGYVHKPSLAPSEGSKINLAAAIAAPITVVVAVALIALATLWHVRSSQHRTLRGGVLPPGPGPSTTLVVTDIQDSTTCWEAVQAEVMDAAVGLHHATIRHVALAHAGYESATEGDSFILAFHTARDAALFAVSVQEALLHVEWPEEILALPMCKEVWVAPVAGTGKRNLKQTLSAAGASNSEHDSDIGTGAGGDGRPGWLPQFLRPSRPSTNNGRWLLRWSSRSSHSTGGGSIKQHVRAWRDVHGASRISRPSATFGWGTNRMSVDQPLTFDTVLMTPSHNAAWSAFEWGLVDNASSPTHAGQQQHRVMPGTAVPRPPTTSSLTGSVEPQPSEAMPMPCAGRPRYSVDTLAMPFTSSEASLFDKAGATDGAVQPRVSVGGTSLVTVGANASRVGDAAAGEDATYFAPITGCGTESLTSASSDMVVSEQLLRAAPVAPGPASGRVLLFRGLRVRIGMACGVGASELNTNAALGRVAFSGRISAAAKAVQDCAQGGMVLCGPDTYSQLSLESLRPQLLALSMGEHVVKVGGDAKESLLFPKQQSCAASAVQLYQLLPRGLMYRAAHLGPVRSVVQRGVGALGAPYGNAAVVFMGVVGHGTLAAHDAEMAAAAVALYQEAAQAALYVHGGYCLEAVEGLCLAAFARPTSAIRWSLDTLHTCLTQVVWPPELLSHELGEEVVATSIIPAEPLMLTAGGLVAARTNGGGLNGQGSADGGAGLHHAASTPHPTPHAAVSSTRPRSTGLAGLSAGVPLSSKAKGVGLPTNSAGVRRGSSGAIAAASGLSLTSGAHVTALQTTQLLFRGLRLRVGIDWGPIKADINAVSARVTCRGKVMNRAARIGAAAKSGQVWVSEGAWNVAHADINMGVGLTVGQAASSRPQSGLLMDGAHSSQPLGSQHDLIASLDGSGQASHVGGVDVTVQGSSASVIREVVAAPLGAFKLKGITDEMSLLRVLYVI